MTDDGLDEVALPSLGDMEQIKRDRWGRPLIKPADGGKEIGYTRVTTFIKVMESTFGLEQWKLRQVACGLAQREDLRRGVDAHAPGYLDGDEGDKKSLNDICKQALEAAGSMGKATIGTALHRITERHDLGVLTGQQVPAWAKDDLDAYIDATRGLEWLAIERMHVNDQLKVAGTPDRIALIDGQPTVVDLKTGAFWASSCAAQLGVYANSDRYDIKTGERIPTNYRRDRALIIHLPAGSGEARLRWVDIDAGWREVSEVAPRLHAWQKRKDLDLGDYEPTLLDVPRPIPTVADKVAAAQSVEVLSALHRELVAEGAWDEDVRALFSERRRQIEGQVAA